MPRHHIYIGTLALILTALALSGCSPMRFVPEGGTLLEGVKLEVDGKTGDAPKASSLRSCIRQEANTRWFSVLKVPMGLYCLSESDSTRGFNRMLRRIGEAPVVTDTALTALSMRTLHTALTGQGYLHAKVDTLSRQRKRHTKLTYHIKPGLRSYVTHIDYTFDCDTMRRLVLSKDTLQRRLYRGMPLDASLLSAERNRLITMLRDKGYYRINKDFVSYVADTLSGEQGVRLTVCIKAPAGAKHEEVYRPYRIGRVAVWEDVEVGSKSDSCRYHGIDIHYNHRPKLLRRVYSSSVALRPDSLYSDRTLQASYRTLNNLGAVSFSSIRLRDAERSEAGWLDADIAVHRARTHTVGAELEGTNTAGNLGAAAALTYSCRNLFRGSEQLSVRLRGAYEAISQLEGYNTSDYIAYSVETSLRFPGLAVPFLSERRRRASSASSEVSLLWGSQDRPEFHRRTLTGAWSYRWGKPRAPERVRHRLDLLSMNYVYMPWVSPTFANDYLQGNDPRYAVLRASYEDLLIMRSAYEVTFASASQRAGAMQTTRSGYQIRLGVETAGNLLRLAGRALGAQADERGRYQVMNIAFSQYAKFDIDLARSIALDERNAVAGHLALGLVLPYGNSDIVPYEKRYFAGGANGVRGWGVRELGPGAYTGSDGKIDFINQTGNLSLLLSLELRTYLFWKLHGALFVDAGNIWNTRTYADLPGARFDLDTFYKQIALSYGLGFRLNFDYFILRLDAGIKAISPHSTLRSEHYPILNPRFHRDFTLHFAVGLPF